MIRSLCIGRKLNFALWRGRSRLRLTISSHEPRGRGTGRLLISEQKERRFHNGIRTVEIANETESIIIQHRRHRGVPARHQRVTKKIQICNQRVEWRAAPGIVCVRSRDQPKHAGHVIRAGISQPSSRIETSCLLLFYSPLILL